MERSNLDKYHLGNIPKRTMDRQLRARIKLLKSGAKPKDLRKKGPKLQKPTLRFAQNDIPMRIFLRKIWKFYRSDLEFNEFIKKLILGFAPSRLAKSQLKAIIAAHPEILQPLDDAKGIKRVGYRLPTEGKVTLRAYLKRQDFTQSQLDIAILKGACLDSEFCVTLLT